jgi:hypothetical protein
LGTHFQKGRGIEKDYHFGFCFDRSTMRVTFDTQGQGRGEAWKFKGRQKSSGATYFYWSKSSKENWLFGPLEEQYELSDVVLHLQYVAKETSGTPVLSANGLCRPTLRLDTDQ